MLPISCWLCSKPTLLSTSYSLVHLLHGEHPAFSLGLVDHLSRVLVLVAGAVLLACLAPAFLLGAHFRGSLREIRLLVAMAMVKDAGGGEIT